MYLNKNFKWAMFLISFFLKYFSVGLESPQYIALYLHLWQQNYIYEQLKQFVKLYLGIGWEDVTKFEECSLTSVICSGFIEAFPTNSNCMVFSLFSICWSNVCGRWNFFKQMILCIKGSISNGVSSFVLFFSGILPTTTSCSFGSP